MINEENIIELYKSNNIVYSLFMELSKLEINGELNSEKYNNIVELIRTYSKKFDRVLYNRNLWNKDFVRVIDLVLSMCNFDKNYCFDYVEELCSNERLNVKRMLQHIFELEQELNINISDPVEEEIDYFAYYDEEEIYFREKDIEFEEMDNNLIKLDYVKSALEVQMFMRYLLDEIKKTRSVKIKNKLIEIKYKLIALYRNLEISFLSNQDKIVNIKHYQKMLDDLKEEDENLFSDYVISLRSIAREIQLEYVDREISKYTNIDEKVRDILNIIRLKSLTSLAYSDEIREEILEDTITAEEMTSKKINKKILKESSKINKKYNLPFK